MFLFVFFDKIHGWFVGWKSARFGLKRYLGTCGCNTDGTWQSHAKNKRLQRSHGILGCPSLQSKCWKIEAAALNDWRSILRKYSQNCSFLIQIILCAHSKMTCCSLWKFAHATWIQIESTFSKDAFSMAMWLCWFLASLSSLKKSDLARFTQEVKPSAAGKSRCGQRLSYQAFDFANSHV